MLNQFSASFRQLIARDKNFRIFISFVVTIFVVLVAVYWLAFFAASGDLKLSSGQPTKKLSSVFDQLYEDKDLSRVIETADEGCSAKIYELRLGEFAEGQWSVAFGAALRDINASDLTLLCPQAVVWGETAEVAYSPQEKDILSLVLTKCDQTFSTSCELMSRMVFGEEYDERPVWAFSEIQKKIGSFACRTSFSYEYYGRPSAEVLVSDGEFQINETIKDLHRHELHQADGMVYAWLDESRTGYQFYPAALEQYLDAGGTAWGSEDIILAGREVLDRSSLATTRCRALADDSGLSFPEAVHFNLIEPE